MKKKELYNLIRKTLSEIDENQNQGMKNENITYYVCDGCPTSGDTFADDPTCGGECSGGCTCKEANTGMTTGGGPGIAGGGKKTTGGMCECHCGTISEHCCYFPWSDCEKDPKGTDRARKPSMGRNRNERIKSKSADFIPPINENKTNKNKMGKKVINERFQQLAGIKPLYENEEDKTTKEITKEDLLNEGPELWTVLGGLMGVIGAAGITTKLQMMAEDPVIAEKYPELEKVFTFLAKIGGALGSGIKEEK